MASLFAVVLWDSQMQAVLAISQVIWELVSWVAAIRVGVVNVLMSSFQGVTGDLVFIVRVSWRENVWGNAYYPFCALVRIEFGA